jgi:hypothetical protein
MVLCQQYAASQWKASCHKSYQSRKKPFSQCLINCILWRLHTKYVYCIQDETQQLAYSLLTGTRSHGIPFMGFNSKLANTHTAPKQLPKPFSAKFVKYLKVRQHGEWRMPLCKDVHEFLAPKANRVWGVQLDCQRPTHRHCQ